MPRANVRDAVATRDEEDQKQLSVQQRLRNAKGWFETVVPSHVDADQFIAMGLGQLSRDADLAIAARENPDSFMVALSECARLGLVPGETFHLTHFNNRHTGKPDIVGIVDYKGEIDLIYRAGAVSAVYAQVVRAGDKFSWRPNMMDLPFHEIAENEHGQLGLLDDSERGELTGVYAYVRLSDGTYSAPIVMSRGEVKKHYDAAKTDKFWGRWPEEGAWTPEMWLKTGLHKLFDRVPHSAEYIRERLRAEAAGLAPGHRQALPAASGPAAGATLPVAEPSPPPAQDPPQRAERAAEPPADPAGPPVQKATLDSITEGLDEFGVTERKARLGAVSALTGRKISKPTELTEAEGQLLLAELTKITAAAGAAVNAQETDSAAVFFEAVIDEINLRASEDESHGE